MRIFIAVILLFAIMGVGGYFALPFLIEKEVSGLREELKGEKLKVAKLEEFVRAEEDARKITQIESGADAAAVIRGINSLSVRVAALEHSLKREMVSADKENRELITSTAAALKKQADNLARESTEIHAELRDVTYKAVIAQIRGHLLKIKTDLLAKNIGTADVEIEVAIGLLEKAKKMVSPEATRSLETFQATLRKAKGDINSDLPATMKRVDLLWHELGK